MPSFDFKCSKCGSISEHYIPTLSSPNPSCDNCGSDTERLPPLFGIVWCRDLCEYDDPRMEGAGAPTHTVWRVRSTRRPDGSPEPVQIRTPKEQADYCKEEGLYNPKELPSVSYISKDGKRMSGRGMPGQEV